MFRLPSATELVIEAVILAGDALAHAGRRWKSGREMRTAAASPPQVYGVNLPRPPEDAPASAPGRGAAPPEGPR